MQNDDWKTSESGVRSKISIFFILGVSIVACALLAIIASQTCGLLAAFGVGALILLASASVGAGFGFLFALPRILAKDDASKDVSPSADGQAAQTLRKRLLGSNTNLERVSDWLTTMIVGVGLTQLASVDGALYRFRMFLHDTAKVFPDVHGGNAGVLPAVGPMVLVFGLVLGFLFVYLYTRIIISTLLNKVEEELQSETLTGKAAVAVKILANTVPGIAENPSLMSLSQDDEPSVYETIELMGSLLYQPGRCQDVIELSGKLSHTRATRSPEYWMYTAAAFGQKYHALKGSGATNTELISVRDNALDCARRAVKIDPSMKTRIWFISDPNGDDDDLADFRNDEDFLRIVGKWTKSS
jgi:hypothetical protein